MKNDACEIPDYIDSKSKRHKSAEMGIRRGILKQIRCVHIELHHTSIKKQEETCDVPDMEWLPECRIKKSR